MLPIAIPVGATLSTRRLLTSSQTEFKLSDQCTGLQGFLICHSFVRKLIVVHLSASDVWWLQQEAKLEFSTCYLQVSTGIAKSILVTHTCGVLRLCLCGRQGTWISNAQTILTSTRLLARKHLPPPLTPDFMEAWMSIWQIPYQPEILPLHTPPCRHIDPCHLCWESRSKHQRNLTVGSNTSWSNYINEV